MVLRLHPLRHARRRLPVRPLLSILRLLLLCSPPTTSAIINGLQSLSRGMHTPTAHHHEQVLSVSVSRFCLPVRITRFAAGI